MSTSCPTMNTTTVRRSCLKQPKPEGSTTTTTSPIITTACKKQRSEPLPRNITWCEGVRVTTIPSIFDYETKTQSVEDFIATVWYGKQEFADFQNCDKALLCIIQKQQEEATAASTDTETSNMIMSSSENDNDELGFCIRGLEHRTKTGSKLKMQNRINVYDAVMDEQESQWEDRIYDPETIAQLYSMHARRAKDMAHQRALGDADYVNTYVRRPVHQRRRSAIEMCKAPEVAKQRVVHSHHPQLRRRSLISSAA